MAKHPVKWFPMLLALILMLTLITGAASAFAGEPAGGGAAPVEGTQSAQAQQSVGEANQAQQTSSPVSYEVNVIGEVWTMSDGVKLPVDVYNPVPKSANETYPVIICIQGWDGDKTMPGWTAEYYAKRGYIGVAFTCRGWFGAEGQIGCMDPEHDIKDVSDIITLVDQDKRFPVLRDDKGPVVGVTGYSGGAAFSYMIAPRKDPRPGDPCDPRIRAVVPMHGPFDLLFSLYPNDACKILIASMLLGGAYMGNMSACMTDILFLMTNTNMDDSQKMATVIQYLSTLINQPINNVNPDLLTVYDIVTQRIYEREDEAKQIFKKRSARYWCDEHYDGTIEHPFTAAMLMIDGYADELFYPNEPLMAFNSAVGPKRVIINNHGHGGDAAITSGGRIPLDDESTWELEQVDNWFDHYLKGIDNGAEKEPRICFYRDQDPANFGQADDYPLPGTSQTSYYLDTDTSGAGKLSIALTENASQDLLINIGFTGSISLPRFQDISGIFGQGVTLDYPSHIDLFDIPFTGQNYVSDSLSGDVTIMGAPKVVTYYQSSQDYTQLDPWVYDVAPDGTETLISQGWYEGHHDGKAWEMANNASHPIEMQACYHKFTAGHRIKLKITTADLIMALPLFTPAFIWLYHSKEMPSSLILPVVPNQY